MKLPGLDYALNLLDKDTQTEFTTFLEDRKKLPDTTEVTSHGGKLAERYSDLPFIGAYNPETITYATFDKMRTHPQIAAGLAAIKLPLLATTWTVECADKDIKDFVYQTLKPLWRSLIRSTLTAIDYGFSAHEKVWEIKELNLKRPDAMGRNRSFFDKSAAVYKKIKSLHPEYITIRTDKLDNFLGITQEFRNINVKLNANKVFIFTHAKGENFGNLYGTSRLKNVYDVWYWWMSLGQFMMRYFERKGSPDTKVRFPAGKTKDGATHSSVALKMGKALANEMVVAIPSTTYGDKTYKWDIEYLMDDKRGEMFVSALNALEIKMLRGLFVPERVLTQDLRTGSYALSRTHFNVFVMELDGLVSDIEDHFTRYIVRPLVEYNFGADAPPTFVEMEKLSQQRREFLAKIFFEMAKTGMIAPAVKEIARELKIPIDESAPPKPKEEETKPSPEEQEKSAREKDEQEKLELEDKKKRWWRDPLPHENPKVLEDIEDTLDKRRDEFADQLNTDILQPQLTQVLKQVDNALKGKQPLKEIWFRKVKTIDAYGREKDESLPWQPLKSKVQSTLNKYHKEFYLFGQKTSIEEMDLPIKPKTDALDLDMLKSRAIAVSDRWLSNIKYATEMAILKAQNKTPEDMKWDVKQEFEKFKNKNLPDIAETEGMTALNLGRRRVVLRHS